jgi:hypothetical protein
VDIGVGTKVRTTAGVEVTRIAGVIVSVGDKPFVGNEYAVTVQTIANMPDKTKDPHNKGDLRLGGFPLFSSPWILLIK